MCVYIFFFSQKEKRKSEFVEQ